MSELQERRYKETTPDKTVKRIKEILKKHKVEVEENWSKKSQVDTYSLRVCIKGTNIGQNGKGMTKEYALASGYAEFLERYQNGMFVFKPEKESSDFPFVYSADEKKLTVEEIAKQDDSFINQIWDDNKESGSKEQVVEQILGNKEKTICLPYYSVRDKRKVYIPNILSCHLCGTNGMCAGNSPEEAMIEGISEILERYVSMQLIYQKIALPEIPNNYLAKFPKVQKMLKKLKENTDYVCKLLDCSFGGKYPVAGLIILQKNTGRFGFKLGAHPDYGIAMERCFTEAAQGMDIFNYAQSCLFDFKNEDTDVEENIREFIYSNVATIPYQAFSKEKTYEFTEIGDVSELTNNQILNKMIDNLLQEGRDILIRDVSSLGFPSYRIIIPGMTEISHAEMAGRFQEFEKLSYYLKDLKRITLNNLKEVIRLLEIQVNEIGFHSLDMFMGIKDTSKLPCEDIGNGTKYFLAICYIMNGEYEKAEKALEDILFIAQNIAPQSLTTILLKAVYYYVSAMNKIKSHEKVMYYMNLLFDEEISNALDESFKNREKIIMKHYNILPDDYVENDDDYFLPFMESLRIAQKENVIDQMKIGKLFHEIKEEILV